MEALFLCGAAQIYTGEATGGHTVGRRGRGARSGARRGGRGARSGARQGGVKGARSVGLPGASTLDAAGPAAKPTLVGARSRLRAAVSAPQCAYGGEADNPNDGLALLTTRLIDLSTSQSRSALRERERSERKFWCDFEGLRVPMGRGWEGSARLFTAEVLNLSRLGGLGAYAGENRSPDVKIRAGSPYSLRATYPATVSVRARITGSADALRCTWPTLPISA